MNENKFLAGHDSDGGAIMTIVMVIIAVIMAAFIACTIGVFIGAFVSLKNYFKAFKENVIDGNRRIPAEAR